MTPSQISRKLKKEADKLIININHLLFAEGVRIPIFRGYHIYKAILIENLRDCDDIIDYLKENGIMI